MLLYINGVVYDVFIIVCLLIGLVLVKIILYIVYIVKILIFFLIFFLINNLLIWFDRWKCDIDIFLNENYLNVSKNRKIMYFFFIFLLFCNVG